MLFHGKPFVSSAGIPLPFKIECDHLKDTDLETLAAYAAKKLPDFGTVTGVPRGGDRLAHFFRKYEKPYSTRLLIVDDVWTTGKNMLYYSSRIVVGDDWIGCVLFERREGDRPPDNVFSIFKMNL